MKALPSLAIVALALGCSGCMGERTKQMARTCQDLLDRSDQSNARTFIRDAEAQLASLDKPGNKLVTYIRELQDPDAMTHKPALEQCLWLLKSRQS